MRHASRILTASILLSATLNAQGHPQTRQGFTISFGLGGGSASFNCNGCASSRESAGTGYLRIGGTFRPDLIVAGQTDAWTKTENGATLTAGTADFVVQWYPQVAGGFYLLGGIGFGSVSTSVDTGMGTLTNNKGGVGYNAGAGYDIRLRRNFSLTPYVAFFGVSTGSNASSLGAANTRITAHVMAFGLGFTWH